ncbi:hypothetical protein SDC9_150631 [bioreactor metagenome]|uniref:Uncharacterized protein n=1 Tax=bioreactor metagenome TaxID=1076179 RepID=A0A645EN22_9ZZZZ
MDFGKLTGERLFEQTAAGFQPYAGRRFQVFGYHAVQGFRSCWAGKDTLRKFFHESGINRILQLHKRIQPPCQRGRRTQQGQTRRPFRMRCGEAAGCETAAGSPNNDRFGNLQRIHEKQQILHEITCAIASQWPIGIAVSALAQGIYVDALRKHRKQRFENAPRIRDAVQQYEWRAVICALFGVAQAQAVRQFGILCGKFHRTLPFNKIPLVNLTDFRSPSL